jgi:sulfide:quinone oxidoreductase
VAKLGENLKSGKAIFTEPAMPIKCAGAPQKILYLWTDEWQKKGLPVEV